MNSNEDQEVKIKHGLFDTTPVHHTIRIMFTDDTAANVVIREDAPPAEVATLLREYADYIDLLYNDQAP